MVTMSYAAYRTQMTSFYRHSREKREVEYVCVGLKRGEGKGANTRFVSRSSRAYAPTSFAIIPHFKSLS
jgi:hypothetical protein